jgi:hypothetical protein
MLPNKTEEEETKDTGYEITELNLEDLKSSMASNGLDMNLEYLLPMFAGFTNPVIEESSRQLYVMHGERFYSTAWLVHTLLTLSQERDISKRYPALSSTVVNVSLFGCDIGFTAATILSALEAYNCQPDYVFLNDLNQHRLAFAKRFIEAIGYEVETHPGDMGTLDKRDFIFRSNLVVNTCNSIAINWWERVASRPGKGRLVVLQVEADETYQSASHLELAGIKQVLYAGELDFGTRRKLMLIGGL